MSNRLAPRGTSKAIRTCFDMGRFIWSRSWGRRAEAKESLRSHSDGYCPKIVTLQLGSDSFKRAHCSSPIDAFATHSTFNVDRE